MQNKKVKKQAKRKVKKRAIIILTALLVSFIALCIAIYFGIRWVVITLKYKEYTNKIEEYGFHTLYNNSKATSTQSVTNAELIKLIVGSIKNETDISKIYNTDKKFETKNEKWLEYASQRGINTIIEDGTKKADEISQIIIATNAIEKMLNIKIEPASLNMSESKLAKYTQDEQTTIAKAVTLGLIENKNSALSNKTLIKGKLNKLVIEIVERYATRYYATVIIDSNGIPKKQEVNIVTDKNKLPTNYEEYPYIVDNIEKEVYEYDFNVVTGSNFQTPQVTYTKMGSLYMQIDEMLTRYLNQILNVDYETITVNKFLNSIKDDVTYAIAEEDVKEYVQYVKDNKIKLQGNAQILLPIIYNDGEQYVIRTKIQLKVLNSNTNYNLLFGDEDNKVKYTGNEITAYIDVPTGMTMNSYSLRALVTCLGRHVCGNNTSIIVEN